MNQDDLGEADQLEHMGHGKDDAITKAFNAMGTVGAVKFHIEATKICLLKRRAWRDQLAHIESQNQSSVGPVLP